MNFINFTICCCFHSFRYDGMSHGILFLYKPCWLAWAQADSSINSEVTKGNKKITELRTILQMESQNS
jgi:hypothetical protein